MQTSFFNYIGNDPRVISIAGKSPTYFKGREYKKLAPKYWFWKKYKDDKDHIFYIYHYYKEVLNKLDPYVVFKELGEDSIITCWEYPFYFCHRRLVANWFYDNLNIKVNEIISSDTIECSTKGIIQLSAFVAKIKINHLESTIEEIYQLSKRFNIVTIKNSWDKNKGKNPDYFEFLNIRFDKELSSEFYTYLWCIYFLQNYFLIDYLNHYNSFTDMFRGKSLNCQADVITRIRHEGLLNVLFSCENMLRMINIDILLKEKLYE